MTSDTPESRSLHGVDHPVFGQVAFGSIGPEERTAYALSSGSDSLQGARGAKLDMAVPNEDSVLVVEQGPKTLLAVADSHFGHLASQVLLQRLEQLVTKGGLPRTPLDLLAILPRLSDEATSSTVEPEFGPDRSETTLLISVLERTEAGLGRGFAVSIGDSALFLVPGEGRVRRIDVPEDVYATPRKARSLDPRRARECAFQMERGDQLLVCTDGVHECCYGDPDRSIGNVHLDALRTQLCESSEWTPRAFTGALAQLALSGVDGHPGGQDNLALAVTRC